MEGISLGKWEFEVELLPKGMLNLWVRRENSSGLEYSNIPFELAGDCIMSDVLNVIESLEE